MKLKSLLLGAAAASVMAPAAMAERGADGHVNVIYWQAPSILNPYLSSGTKDIEAASLVIEPVSFQSEQTLIWMMTVWALLPASILMRGIALMRVAELIEEKRRRVYAKAEGLQNA